MNSRRRKFFMRTHLADWNKCWKQEIERHPEQEENFPHLWRRSKKMLQIFPRRHTQQYLKPTVQQMRRDCDHKAWPSKIRRYVSKSYARRNMPSGVTATQRSTVVSSATGSLWRPTSQNIWTLSYRVERLKDTPPESSIGMASSAWTAEWFERCKSSWATLKCTNGTTKRCKWVTVQKQMPLNNRGRL